jgi:hypothetical protein
LRRQRSFGGWRRGWRPSPARSFTGQLSPGHAPWRSIAMDMSICQCRATTTCPSPTTASSGHAHLPRQGVDILPLMSSRQGLRRTCPALNQPIQGHAHPRRRGLDILPPCPVVSASVGHARRSISASRDMPIRGGEDWTYCHHVQLPGPPKDMPGPPSAHRGTCPGPGCGS